MTVPIQTEYFWLCPSCGRRNVVKPEPVTDPGILEDADAFFSEGEEWKGDPKFEPGPLMSMPVHVTCECGHEDETEEVDHEAT